MSGRVLLLKKTILLWLFFIFFMGNIGVLLWGTPISLAPFWGDNMVLQSGYPIHIGGQGKIGATIFVSLGKYKKKTRVKEDGSWLVTFAKMAPSDQYYTLEISSDEQVIRYNNILIGDVWVCIGQYNMIFPMKNESHFMEEYTAATTVNTLRFFSPSNITLPYGLKTEYPEEIKKQLEKGVFYNGKWKILSKESIENTSAIAYYFAKRIQADIKVPIGIINLAVEGSPIEAWIGENTFTTNRKLTKKIRGNWMTSPYLPLWARKVGSYNLTGTPDPPNKSTHTTHPFMPGFLYNVGIKALKNLSFKGILMYGGETNSDTQKHTQEYSTMLSLLIKSYRKFYKNDRLPFFWVQLPSIENEEYTNALFWPEFRQQQLSVMKIINKNVGIVPSYDLLGHNTTPSDKKVVAERLAALTLLMVYHKKTDLYPPAPTPISASYQKTKGGVIIRFNNVGKGLETFGNPTLLRFSINGSSDTHATIYSSHSILVKTTKKPKFIYYAWKPNASDANLVNSAKIPVLAFKIKIP